MIDIGRGSSVVAQALPRPGQGNNFKHPEEKQGKLCNDLGKVASFFLHVVFRGEANLTGVCSSSKPPSPSSTVSKP